ncbi:hypothetical protein C8R45DRAFT_1112708 [Mycena sanguinolenta]|nr:hypothetical protein C8R45DRAFT_1112708 [Mycena sanguinolenta]
MPCPVSPEQRATLALLEAFRPVSTCVNCAQNGLESDCGGLKLEYFRFRFTQGSPLPFSLSIFSTEQLLHEVPAAFRYLRRAYFDYQKLLFRSKVESMTDILELKALFVELFCSGYSLYALNLVSRQIRTLDPRHHHYPTSGALIRQ